LRAGSIEIALDQTNHVVGLASGGSSGQRLFQRLTAFLDPAIVTASQA
jgi:hypothetical protein